MSKKNKNMVVAIMVLLVVAASLLIVNFFEKKDDDAVKGNLIIWTKSDTYEYMKKAATDFMEQNGKTDIKVMQVQEDEVNDAISKDNVPDIVELSSLEIRNIEKQYDDKSFVISEGAISSFAKNYTKARILEVETIDGELLGIPITSRPLVLYLREDMLNSYGYTYSQISTWEDLINIGKDIKERSAGKVKILNAVDSDYNDLISLLIMQAMEEKTDEDAIKTYVDNSINELKEAGILNTNKKGQFLARISSNNGMYELSKIDEKCEWIACNVPAKYNGSNRFYVAEGNNFVVLKNYDKNAKLIKKFMDFISNDNLDKSSYILNGDFFTCFLSAYNGKLIESPIKNFTGMSPVIRMDNIMIKAPAISDYNLYMKIKDQYK